MTTKILTKAQKKAEVKKQITQMLKDVKSDLFKDIDKAMNSGAVPEEFYQEGTFYLSKCLIDNFCTDRPYKPLNPATVKEYYNIHLFI